MTQTGNFATRTYSSDIAAAYDYYPFGMLMPGRYISDTSSKCVNLSKIVMIPKVVKEYIQITAVSAVKDDGSIFGSPSPTPISTGFHTTLGNGGLVVLHSADEFSSGRLSYTSTNVEVNLAGLRDGASFCYSVTPDSLTGNVQFGFDAGFTNVQSATFSVYQFTDSSNVEYNTLISEAAIELGLQNYSFNVDADTTLLRNGGRVIVRMRTIPYLDAGDAVAYLQGPWRYKTIYEPSTVYTKVCSGDDQYRFGYQNQEKDNEIAGIGNSMTAEFWQYDTRIGRRWNVDQVKKAHESSYASFANNPVTFIDPSGADTVDVKSGTTDVNGKTKADKGFDKTKMMTLFVAKTSENSGPDGTEIRRSQNWKSFSNDYSINGSEAYSETSGSGNTARHPAKVLSVNRMAVYSFGLMQAFTLSDLNSLRSGAINDINGSWLSLDMDKLKYLNHGSKYDIKSSLLRGRPYVSSPKNSTF